MRLEYLIYGSQLCVALAALLALIALLVHKRKWALPILTGGIYLALVLLLVLKSWLTDGEPDLYAIMMAADCSLDVFLLDYRLEHLPEFSAQALKTDYRAYAAFLLVLAPVLTLSNVLALFRTAIDRLRYTIIPGPKYILSELNEESVALAESIRKKHAYAQIVFTGVDNPKEKYDNALLERAREISALCLKQDVSRIRLGIFLRKNLVFLISHHEPENVADAIALIERYKNGMHKVELYVYANTPESKIAIDAADKGDSLLGPGFRKYLNKKMKPILDRSERWDKQQILDFVAAAPLKSRFSVRCLDMAELTVRNLLQDNFDAIRKKAKDTKTVSIAILGFGRHGSALLKTAVWMFQLYGYRLEINVFDKDGTACRRLQQEAPELLQDPGSLYDDDASHDILFIGGDRGNNCLDSDFDNQFFEYWERLKKTQLVFVSLGDDSQNIAAAIHFRELFQRKQFEDELAQASPEKRKDKVKELKSRSQKVCKEELPWICALVTDPDRSANLTINSAAPEKERSRYEYNIKPAGSMTAVYHFDNIRKLMALEELALRCHLQWCVKSILIEKAKADAGTLDDHNQPVKMNSEMAIENLVKDTQQYVRNSYYRDSSVAMVIHQLHMVELRAEFEEQNRKEKSMITEHMRWNAYMRAIGYQRSAIRNDRVKLHPLIVPYHELEDAEKEKDLIEFKEETECIFQNPLIPQM